MSLITWNEKFSVHIKEIDDQHKRWVDMLNNLYDAMKEGKGFEKVGETLDGLVEYTKTHFVSEEKLMRINGYPFYEGHKKIHDDMVKEVELLRMRYQSGETMLSIDVMQFLKNWLTDHIMGTDRNFGPYLNSKGVV